MRLQEMEAALREIVAGLEPERLSADAAVGLVDTFVCMEKLVAAGKALAARRVAASNLWRGAGERSAAHWLARRSGVSIGNALATLETAARLPELPGVDRAVRAGELSAVQANEIASAAGADPGAEADLLAVARDDGFALRDKCRRVKAAAAPDEMARHRAIHASRCLRHWSDPDGAGRLEGRFTPEVLAELLVALEPFEAEAFRVARDEGRREGFDAYRADALLALARAGREGNGPGSSAPRNTVHVVIDHAALLRGKAEAGERCEVAGGGGPGAGARRALAAGRRLRDRGGERRGGCRDRGQPGAKAHRPSAQRAGGARSRVRGGWLSRAGGARDRPRRALERDARHQARRPGPAVPVPSRPEDARGLPAGGRSRALALAEARRQRHRSATTAISSR